MDGRGASTDGLGGITTVIRKRLGLVAFGLLLLPSCRADELIVPDVGITEPGVLASGYGIPDAIASSTRRSFSSPSEVGRSITMWGTKSSRSRASRSPGPSTRGGRAGPRYCAASERRAADLVGCREPESGRSGADHPAVAWGRPSLSEVRPYIPGPIASARRVGCT